jgi:chemotaxis protein methyltransferase WspC
MMNNQPILDLLRQRLGLDPRSIGLLVLEQVINQRLQLHSFRDVEAYARFLERDTQEWNFILEAVVVPESWFFRGGELFRTLADWLRLHRRELRIDRPLRVLSIPSGNGEEPYSLAIALQDLSVDLRDIQVLGVDLSRAAVDRAIKGIYGSFAFRRFDPKSRPGLFQQVNEQSWQINSMIRQRVQFRVGNLLDFDFLQGEAPFDLIFCRNLFIYFDTPAKQLGLKRLTSLLAPGGRLCLSSSEAATLPMHEFARVGAPEWFWYQRQTSTKQPDLTPLPTVQEPMATPMPSSATVRVIAPTTVPPKTASELLAEAKESADRGEGALAKQMVEESLQRHRTAEGFALLGTLLQGQHNLEGAEKAFRDALYLEPNHESSLTSLYVLLERQGRQAQATLLRQRIERQMARVESR